MLVVILYWIACGFCAGAILDFFLFLLFFFFQAEDGIRDLVRSRGLGDVYKRQPIDLAERQIGETTRFHFPCFHDRQTKLVSEALHCRPDVVAKIIAAIGLPHTRPVVGLRISGCLLYTSDAADDLLCVDLGGRRIIKKKKNNNETKN